MQEATQVGTRRRPVVIGLLIATGFLAIAALVVGLAPIYGEYDSEGFYCGSAWLQYDDGGYRGTDGYATCEDTRRGRIPGSLVLLAGAGVLLVVAVGVQRRQSRASRDAGDD